MPEETSELQKLKEQYPEIANNLPPRVARVFFSDETSVKIADICSNNGVADADKISQVAYLTAMVFLGGVKIEEFGQLLTQEVNIQPESAADISKEIEGNIFSGIADELNMFYQETPAQTAQATKRVVDTEIPQPATKKDSYRETIE